MFFPPDDPPGPTKKRPPESPGAIAPGAKSGAALLIVGVSARAAAQSARRGGLRPIAVDAFGDADLRVCCPTTVAAPFPVGIAAAADVFSAEQWMYCGALENRPELVEALSQRRRLLGCNAETIRSVRVPTHVEVVLRSIHEIGPRVLERPPDFLSAKKWLFKPLASGGGRGIHRWPSAEALAALERGQPGYWQALVEGRPCSAAYLADGAHCTLLGLTRQLVGRAWGAAGDYEYCGSIGPIELSARSRALLESIGQAFTEVFGLCGLYGVDFIRDFRGFWPLEVNPRYTASMELFDWAWGESLVAWHVAACRGEMPVVQPPSAGGYFGKLIVFSRDEAMAPHGLWDQLREQEAGPGWPAFGDVPLDGAAIPPGGPVATVFARADTLPALRQALRSRASWLRQRLGLR